MNKQQNKIQRSKKSIVSLSKKNQNTHNIPTSRNKNQKATRNKNQHQNWKTCFEQKVHQITPELQGKLCFFTTSKQKKEDK